MKANLLLSMLALAVTSMGAQIPNTGFENLNTDGSVKNWGSSLLTIVAIDSLGNAHADSIVFDQELYFSTNDAHSGTKAVEMRNAFNYTGNYPIAGSINVLSNDSDYSSFGAPVRIIQQPANFSFYYKFMPVANDTAVAMISLTDSSGTLIGDASIEITGQHNAYTLANMPITYYGTGQAYFAVISFSTAKAGTYPAFGTRFLVDDVNTILTGLEDRAGDKAMSCFPNPAKDHLVIVSSAIRSGEKVTVTATDISGNIIELGTHVFENQLVINTSVFSQGCYVLTIHTGEAFYHTKFLKVN